MVESVVAGGLILAVVGLGIFLATRRRSISLHDYEELAAPRSDDGERRG